MVRTLLRPRILVPVLILAAAAGGYAWWRSQSNAAPAERWRVEAADKGDVVQAKVLDVDVEKEAEDDPIDGGQLKLL